MIGRRYSAGDTEVGLQHIVYVKGTLAGKNNRRCQGIKKERVIFLEINSQILVFTSQDLAFLFKRMNLYSLVFNIKFCTRFLGITNTWTVMRKTLWI